MTMHQPFAQFAEDIRPVSFQPAKRNRGERVFDLHPAIHFGLVGAYLTFMGVLATSFMGPDLVIPTVIFGIGILSLFVTPAWWARVKGDDLPKQSWADFCQEGVECLTGKLTANQALAQIMVLPALMVGLAFFFAVLKSTL